MKKEIPQAAHNPIRNLGSLIILVSPVFNILGGSWTHLICLLCAQRPGDPARDRPSLTHLGFYGLGIPLRRSGCHGHSVGYC